MTKKKQIDQTIIQRATREEPKEIPMEKVPQKKAKTLRNKLREYEVAIFKGNPVVVKGIMVDGLSVVRAWDTNFKGTIRMEQPVSWQLYEGDYAKAKDIYDHLKTPEDINGYLLRNLCPANNARYLNEPMGRGML